MHPDAWLTPPSLQQPLPCKQQRTSGWDGIGKGLAIQGKGTFKFSIKDNEGRVHTIKIPNSHYLPELRQCILSPQH